MTPNDWARWYISVGKDIPEIERTIMDYKPMKAFAKLLAKLNGVRFSTSQRTH